MTKMIEEKNFNKNECEMVNHRSTHMAQHLTCMDTWPHEKRCLQ